MAVFIAASDETGGSDRLTGLHTYGGYVLSEFDWSNWFAPAWQERVLNGPPAIPYLHMTEIRSRQWREKYGLSRSAAESRVDEAVRVIRSMGALYPVTCSLPQAGFQKEFAARLAGRDKEIGAIAEDPDYLNFLWYSFETINRATMWNPNVEKVDFVVEANGKITDHIKGFHKQLAELLESIARHDLVQKLGN